MPILGDDCKLYVSETLFDEAVQDQTALEAASAVDIAQDVTVSMTKEMVEYRSRATGSWKRRIMDVKDAQITHTILWESGNAEFALLRDAYLNDEEVAAWALDGDAEAGGSQGPAGNFVVSEFSRNEPVGNTVTANVTLLPSSFTHWHTVDGPSEPSESSGE